MMLCPATGDDCDMLPCIGGTQCKRNYLKRQEQQAELERLGHPYGYCPICGEPGKMRERRPNGDDRCFNDHRYKSASALLDPILAASTRQYYKPPVIPPDEIERRREAGVIDNVRLRVSRVLNNLNEYPLHSDKIDAILKAVKPDAK